MCEHGYTGEERDNCACDSCESRNAAYVAPPGPAALPTCDYCGDDFLVPRRGYKHGCPKHDPAVKRRAKLELLESDYGVVRAIIRHSQAANVEIALIALDRMHDAAKTAVKEHIGYDE